MFNQYLHDLELQGKREKTIVEYRARLAVFREWLDKTGIKAVDITVRDMLNFRTFLLEDRNNCNRRVNAVISTVRQMYALAELSGKVEHNPCSMSLKLRSKHVRKERLSDDSIRCFVDYIDNLRSNSRAAFYTLMATGARVSEVTKLLPKDFKLVDGTLWIDIKDAKWESDRCIPFTDSASQEIVLQYLKSIDDDTLPAFRISTRTLQLYAHRFQEDTGIIFHCHLLRHTVASKLLENGTKIEMIQFLLGHKTVNMTSYYTQAAQLDLSELAPTSFQSK